jgi:DNA-binding CsgD family transcriptional regulator
MDAGDHVGPRDRFKVRQQRIRASGACIVCHLQVPCEQRAVCDLCNEKAKARVRQSRARRRSSVLSQYEAAGDDAARRFAYADAENNYQRAITIAQEDADHARLAEKLGKVLQSGGQALEARSWLLRAISAYERAGRTRDVLQVSLRLAHQYWVEGDSRNGLLAIDKALNALSANRGSEEFLVGAIKKATTLNLMDRFPEAEIVLDSIAAEIEKAPGETRAGYYRGRGVLAAVAGRQDEAYAEFERARGCAMLPQDGFALTLVWDEQAYRAIAFGDTKTALMCSERAMTLAQRFRLNWSGVGYVLEHAKVLHLVGESERAATLVRKVLKSVDETPVNRMLLAANGVPIALAVGDSKLARLCAAGDVVELAFGTGEPQRIIPVATAFAELLYRERRAPEAEALIRRALRHLCIRDYAWELAVLVLRHSTDAKLRSDVVQQFRMLPGVNSPAAVAMQHLVTAFSTRNRPRAQRSAAQAVREFTALGWTGHAALAKELVASFERQPKIIREQRAGDDAKRMEAQLTRRQRDVAALARSGLTNKMIAKKLAISEYTVESHMASILGRLGLRSRWQLPWQ